MKYKAGDRVYIDNKKYTIYVVWSVLGMAFIKGEDKNHGLPVALQKLKPIITCK